MLFVYIFISFFVFIRDVALKRGNGFMSLTKIVIRIKMVKV